MPTNAPAVPKKVRLAAEQAGQAGAAWLSSLADTLVRIERDWGVRVGAAVGRGSEAYVVHAETREGRPAALKIVTPWTDPGRRELAILREARGRGYAELIRADEKENILLLEGLGALLANAPMTDEERIAVICGNLQIAWTVRGPAASAMPSGAEKAVEFAQIIESLWLQTGQPCSRRTVDAAMASAERRQKVFDPARAVLSHGDAHAWNLLEVTSEAGVYKLIDPDGAFAEPAFDLAVMMREWGDGVPSGDLVELSGQRCRLLSRISGEDPFAIWDWALLHCLSSGLDLLRIGALDAAAPQLAMSEAWVARVPAFA